MKVVIAAALLAVLAAERHRVVAAIRELRIVPSAADRVEAAVARARRLLTVELGAMKLELGDSVFLRVLKEEQILEVWMKPRGETDFVHYKTYVLSHPAGEPGTRTGDGDTQLPEGLYVLDVRSLRLYGGRSLALDVGYPNELDRFHDRPGRPVLVQGECAGAGPLVLRNGNMEELYALVAAALEGGQNLVQIHLFPFRLTDERMDRMQKSGTPWLELWANLKEGYDYFEIVRRPPRVSIKADKYAFE